MWLGPLSTPIAPPVAARRSMNAPRSSAGQTSLALADAGGDAPGARLLLGARLRQGDPPSRRRPGAAELDPARLGPELVGARGAVDEDDGARSAAPPARPAARPNDGGASTRVPSARATSSRARSSAWLCGSTRIACVTSQRAGHSWLAPSVRLARP